MYRKQVRRRRAILVLLVVACLMLISISISEAESGPLHSVQNGVSSILSPIGDGASRALKPARDLVNWFDETINARGENDKLNSEVADLRQQLLDTQTAAEKAGYAQALDKLVAAGGLTGYQRVDASVVLRSATAWYGTVTIDKGKGDGISKDDAVVTADGLVGHVSEVTGGTSQVTLITDSNGPVTARVVGKGPEGIVSSIVGDPGKLSFGLIQGEGKMKKGDDLVTAGFSSSGGLDSRYPAEIPIGRISDTIPEQQQQAQEVHIEPFANLDDLNQVTVLTGGAG
jgi:rod shape-determining protein MreC